MEQSYVCVETLRAQVRLQCLLAAGTETGAYFPKPEATGVVPVHCDIEAGLRQLLSDLTLAPADATDAGLHLRLVLPIARQKEQVAGGRPAKVAQMHYLAPTSCWEIWTVKTGSTTLKVAP